jgi:hypothetical protein
MTAAPHSPQTGRVIRTAPDGNRSILATVVLAVADRVHPNDPVAIKMHFAVDRLDTDTLRDLLRGASDYGVTVRTEGDLYGFWVRSGIVHVTGPWWSVHKYLHHWAFRTGEK